MKTKQNDVDGNRIYTGVSEKKSNHWPSNGFLKTDTDSDMTNEVGSLLQYFTTRTLKPRFCFEVSLDLFCRCTLLCPFVGGQFHL